jgi:hypothetical protein
VSWDTIDPTDRKEIVLILGNLSNLPNLGESI